MEGFLCALFYKTTVDFCMATANLLELPMHFCLGTRTCAHTTNIEYSTCTKLGQVSFEKEPPMAWTAILDVYSFELMASLIVIVMSVWLIEYRSHTHISGYISILQGFKTQCSLIFLCCSYTNLVKCTSYIVNYCTQHIQQCIHSSGKHIKWWLDDEVAESNDKQMLA